MRSRPPRSSVATATAKANGAKGSPPALSIPLVAPKAPSLLTPPLAKGRPTMARQNAASYRVGDQVLRACGGGRGLRARGLQSAARPRETCGPAVLRRALGRTLAAGVFSALS